MYFIFGVFVIFIIGTSILKRLYSNPYTLTHIFGKKGSGKSCLMVNEMIKHLKRGWIVYTDMTDIKIPGVRIISAKDLKYFRPEYHTLLCLDEVGIEFDNRKFKSFDDGYRDFFKFQRKYKVKVIMNSQAFDIDLKIRDLVDDMILQTNLWNCISISRPIRRSITLTEPSAEAESRIADRLSFAPIWEWRFYWMPRYFKYFDSFSAPEREEMSFTISENQKFSKRLLRKIERAQNR